MSSPEMAQAASGALKKKALVCSSEAAAISIGIHVLLVLFAGSIVAIKYVQKRDAAFAGENISRPKLERRQLQMPVKVQNLQKKSSRPKVTSRMASVSKSGFSLPDMMGMGDIAGGFDRSGGGERSLSSMGAAGSLGFGVAGVNFFGAKSKGEKIIFIVSANREMMLDERGGYFTYNYAKDRLGQMIDGLSSATLFNVMFYSGSTTVMFRSKLVAANSENRADVKAWYARVNDTPSNVGNLSGMSIVYTPRNNYEDAPASADAKNWVKAIQAALEQVPDNIFLLGAGYGIQYLSRGGMEKVYGVDMSKEAEAAWLKKRGWDEIRLAELTVKAKAINKRFEETLARENEERKKKGLPPRILGNLGTINQYKRDNNIQGISSVPPRYDTAMGGNKITADLAIDNFRAIIDFNYKPKKLDDPKIHIVKLIASDGRVQEKYDPQGNLLRSLKKIPNEFRGKFELLRGAKSMENIMQFNKGLSE